MHANELQVYHAWALYPLVSPEGRIRLFLFFFLNGIATVIDYAIWRNGNSYLRTFISWVICTVLATWTVAECNVPNGILAIPWNNLC